MRERKEPKQLVFPTRVAQWAVKLLPETGTTGRTKGVGAAGNDDWELPTVALGITDDLSKRAKDQTLRNR